MGDTVAQRIAMLSAEKRDLLLQKIKKQAVIEPIQIEEQQNQPLRPASIPLSFAQKRLWFLDQLHPGETAYTIPAAYWLEGALEEGILRKCFEQLIERHEILRTTFHQQAGQPCQIIAATPSVSLPIVDLQQLPASERRSAALNYGQQLAAHPFDLQQGPLWHLCLLRLDACQHLLVICMHHSISDGWSLNILLDELIVFYQANVQKEAISLLPLPLQYADYACWQQEWQRSFVYQQQLAYWRQQLASAPALSSFPTDHPRPAIPDSQGTNYHFSLPVALISELKLLCQQEGVTMYMLLLTTFQILLARYSGAQDIVVGTPIANRTRSEHEALIGFFVNTLAIRTDLSDDPAFCKLLRRVRNTLLDAYAHQDMPFEQLVEALQPERQMSFASSLPGCLRFPYDIYATSSRWKYDHYPYRVRNICQQI